MFISSSILSSGSHAVHEVDLSQAKLHVSTIADSVTAVHEKKNALI